MALPGIGYGYQIGDGNINEPQLIKLGNVQTAAGTATLTGNMVVSGSADVAVVADTAAGDGILFSSANFTAGSKAVTAGDILNVVYSIGL